MQRTPATSDRQLEAALAQVARLEAKLARTETTLARVTSERDKLRDAYERLKEQLELLRRRIYAAKAERIDVTQLELEFAETKKRLEVMATALAGDADPPPANAPPPPAHTPSKPKGRRDLTTEDMPEERIVLLDPAREGREEPIGFEESCRLAYRRASPVRLVVARAKYRPSVPAEASDALPPSGLSTVSMPKELFERGLLAPTMIAHILVQKYRWGLPFHRQERMLAAEGIRLDDGTMGRYAEHVGASLGCIVEASAKDARESAFCLSTDATGVCIQPDAEPGRRQACRKGHFFVVLADQDHVFFEYQPKHTSAAVCDMFRGFSGYIQADAHAVYDAVFRGEARAAPTDDSPLEVGCWSHARRKMWEAAVVAKDAAAREALLRVHALFERERQWASLAPAQRHARRQLEAKPLLDDFFRWTAEQYARVKDTRGLVASAFGYAVRQERALRRYLDDGRLPMTNNHSERALRGIAVGRKAWMFFGSDDHASAAANLFSLIASAELHGLDVEEYLAEIIHVVPYWPRDRFLELAPKYWRATRARIAAAQLAREVGDITVPPPLAASEQTTSR